MSEPNIIFQQNKKSGVVYAYEDHPYWDPEKQRSRSNRKLLGKVDPSTGDIVPTRGRKKKATTQTQDEPAYSIGAGQIINKVLAFLMLFMCETLAKRIVSMLLIVAGLPEGRVAESTGLCDKSVRTLKKGLENEEIDNLFHVAGGGRKRKLIDVEELVIEDINNNNYHSHQQIADMIHEKHGIRVSLPAISRLLKKTESND